MPVWDRTKLALYIPLSRSHHLDSPDRMPEILTTEDEGGGPGGKKGWFKEKQMLRVSGHHGRGLGIGEVQTSTGDDDGCGECGCLQEEVCCPAFWNDNGVPPIWPLNKILNPKNQCLNNNKRARIFGNLGFPYFDRKRKPLMGTALALTVLAIVFTSFGCFALSTSTRVLRQTAFGYTTSTIADDDGGGGGGGKVTQVCYMGLRKFVVEKTASDGTRSVDELWCVRASRCEPLMPQNWVTGWEVLLRDAHRSI